MATAAATLTAPRSRSQEPDAVREVIIMTASCKEQQEQCSVSPDEPNHGLPGIAVQVQVRDFLSSSDLRCIAWPAGTAGDGSGVRASHKVNLHIFRECPPELLTADDGAKVCRDESTRH